MQVERLSLTPMPLTSVESAELALREAMGTHGIAIARAHYYLAYSVLRDAPTHPHMDSLPRR